MLLEVFLDSIDFITILSSIISAFIALIIFLVMQIRQLQYENRLLKRTVEYFKLGVDLNFEDKNDFDKEYSRYGQLEEEEEEEKSKEDEEGKKRIQ